MNGADEVMLKLTHGVMDNANGQLPGSDQLDSMYLKVVISNYAIVKCQPMLHSVVELIKQCLELPIGITEDSGVYGESLVSG